MIFIIGCGRSGTHLLADCLQGPDTVVMKEERPQFPWSIAMARNTARQKDLYPLLAEHYRELKERHEPKLFVDKTQPNMWIAEKLADEFPTAKFIGIERGILPVVSSTLLHDGFALNIMFSLSFSMPCPFFGIFDYTWYELPIEQQYALRWVAHRVEMERLRKVLGDRLVVVQYEDLVNWPLDTVDKLEEFIGLMVRPVKGNTFDKAPLKKWRQNLTEEQVRLIEEVWRG